jgi:upstream activation factor subunit UAF30
MAMKKTTKKAAKTAQKSAKKTTKKATAKAAGATKTTAKAAGATKTKRKLNPALTAPYTPSPQLAEVIGATPLSRQKVVSKLWEYIKQNGLQDKQNINADDKLKPIFGKKTVTMFEMQKHISKHLTKA